MIDTLEKLKAVQEHDKKIIRYEKEKEDIPAREADIREHVKDAQQALQEAEDRLKSEKVKLNEIEVGVESTKEKIQRLQLQEYEVKNNDEYRAIQKEIFSLKQQIMKFEDEELSWMEEMDKTRELLAARKADVEEQESHIQEDIDILEERMEELESELARLKTERAELVQQVEPKWLQRYERVVGHRGGTAIVSVESKTCTGCHMTLPPQTIQNVKRGQKIEFCDFCGRILTMPE